MKLTISDNPEAIRSLLVILTDDLAYYRREYVRVSHLKDEDGDPTGLWACHLELIETLAEAIKNDIKEVRNGTYEIELPDRKL